MPAECRNGHDLSVLGKIKDGSCRACHNVANARVDAARQNTVSRQLTLARARQKYRTNAKIVRIEELERMLNAS